MQHTIFVSSTFVDLQSHRKAVWDTLAEFDVAVRGMEQFGARTETPLQTCLFEVDQADIYVGIIAFRLGSIESQSGKSYTQLEYERALTRSKEILIYLVDEANAPTYFKDIDQGEALEKLNSFKRILRERHTVETFKDKDDLAKKLKRDIEHNVTPKELKIAAGDEFAESKMWLQSFLLLPKTVAGIDVRLKVRISGEPYLASNAVCQTFNFEFGATFGIPVEVVMPEGISCADVFDLYVDAKHAETILPIKEDDFIDGYMRLHFSPADVGDARALYRSKIEYPNSPFQIGGLNSVLGRPVHYEADARLALELSKAVKVTRTPAARA